MTDEQIAASAKAERELAQVNMARDVALNLERLANELALARLERSQEGAVVNEPIKPSNRCYLIMEYEGAEYLGVLRFESYSVCEWVYDLLLQHRGESIQEDWCTKPRISPK